jgi:hypothetical protein
MHLLVEAHHGLSIVAILTSLLWTIIVFAAPRRAIGLRMLGRLVHFAAIAAAGLYGASGSIILAAQMKPGLGLLLACAVIASGFAGRAGRSALSSGRKMLAVRVTMLQIALLGTAIGGMSGLAT